MLVRPSPIGSLYLFASLFFAAVSHQALTLSDLRSDSNLTPARFASFFRNFDFDFRKEVQPPDAFLAARAGDCDDYSTLAAAVLREKGYTPRLVSIRMPGVTHVVCYIEETNSYLDYNYRACANPTVASGRELSAIAESVAKSYRTKWLSVSEFTYGEGVKRLVQTVTEPRKDTKTFAALFR